MGPSLIRRTKDHLRILPLAGGEGTGGGGKSVLFQGYGGALLFAIAATTLILLGLLMGNEVAQASGRKSLIITPFGTIFFHPASR